MGLKTLEEQIMDVDHSSCTPSTSFTGAPSTIDSSADSVTCPNCRTKIPLTQAIRAELEERAKARMEAELRRREAGHRIETERAVAAATAQAEARTKEAQAGRMADLEAQVLEKSTRIEQAAAIELELRRRQRELEDKEKTLTLEVARRVDAERKKAEQQATERLTEEFRLREAPMQEKLASMTRTIENLKRKAEQGSQQTQGEASEVELESVLRQAFPLDDVAPVSKGARGADIVHIVRTDRGTDCAAIVWESKNAKAWSPKWLEKIRDDQREAKADLAVIVTNVMPSGITSIGQVEGVWICDLGHAALLAIALRAQLHAVHRERSAAEGRATKESYLYDYVTGNEFQQRVVAAVSTLSQMRTDVERERNLAMRAFAKRDKQIVAAAGCIVEIYGGAQGIIGASLPAVALLEMPDDDETGNDADGSFGLLSS